MEEGLGDESGPGASGVVFFFFFLFYFSCLYWILFYLSVQIFAMDNMRKREMSCPYHNITSVALPYRAGLAANIKNHTEPVPDVEAMGIQHDSVSVKGYTYIYDIISLSVASLSL